MYYIYSILYTTTIIMTLFNLYSIYLYSCSIFTPVDVVKERLQVQSNHQHDVFKYNGSIHALRTIIQEEGLKGIYIYKGYDYI